MQIFLRHWRGSSRGWTGKDDALWAMHEAPQLPHVCARMNRQETGWARCFYWHLWSRNAWSFGLRMVLSGELVRTADKVSCNLISISVLMFHVVNRSWRWPMRLSKSISSVDFRYVVIALSEYVAVFISLWSSVRNPCKANSNPNKCTWGMTPLSR